MGCPAHGDVLDGLCQDGVAASSIVQSDAFVTYAAKSCSSNKYVREAHCAGLHRLPQFSMVIQSYCSSLGANYGALGHHPQAGCQSEPSGNRKSCQSNLALIVIA